MAKQVETVQESKNKITPGALQHQRDKDREKVKGIFRFHEVPGGRMGFSIKLYKQDPVENYDLIDGEVYTIPLGVAKHLNKNGWHPEYEYATDEHGRSQHRVAKKIKRFSFQSLEFVDIEDFGTPNQIITVEKVA